MNISDALKGKIRQFLVGEMDYDEEMLARGIEAVFGELKGVNVNGTTIYVVPEEDILAKGGGIRVAATENLREVGYTELDLYYGARVFVKEDTTRKACVVVYYHVPEEDDWFRILEEN